MRSSVFYAKKGTTLKKNSSPPVVTDISYDHCSVATRAVQSIGFRIYSEKAKVIHDMMTSQGVPGLKK